MNYKDDAVKHLNLILNDLQLNKIQLLPLRYKEINAEVAYTGDYDFLTSSEQLNAVLETIFSFATEYCFSFSIDRSKYGKTVVNIYNTNDEKSILLEIWTYLDLVAHDSLKYIFFDDLEKYIVEDEQKASVLAIEIEALYYLLHLQSKNKSLETPLVIQRIQYYKNLTENNQFLHQLYHALDTKSKTIQEVAHEAIRYLKENKVLFTKREIEKFKQEQNIRILRAKRRIYVKLLKLLHIVPVVGPDGVGKSSIITKLKKSLPRIKEYRFKSLFRHTILYSISRVFLKRKLETKAAKNQYDDIFGGWIVKIAFLRYPLLILKSLFSQKYLFIDRYFHDFIIQNLRLKDKEVSLRTDWKRLLQYTPNSFGFIHLDAPTEVILSRKDELSKDAIEQYRKLIFQLSLEKSPILYIYINTSNDITNCEQVLLQFAKKIGIKC